MRITESQLRMDAVSGHRDVRVSQWTGWQAGGGGDKADTSFKLPLDRDDNDSGREQQTSRPPPPAPRSSQLVFEQQLDYLDFHAAGELTTADGRTIDFSLDLTSVREETSINLRGAFFPWLIDPLVLSFDNSVSLAPERFSFDLDGDGQSEQIASLNQETGFLALDRNGDGLINNGLELFGPATGAGFAELGEFDLDRNGWIDEGDPVFGELLVWLAAGSEEARLVSLQEAGVGALALASTETSFALKDSRGALLGEVTRAGLFFMENGEARSLQEVDLSVFSPDQEAELRSQPLATMAEALTLLRQLVVRRRQQVAALLLRASGGRRDDESLADKFWQWQNEHRDEKQLAADLLARRVSRPVERS